MSALTSEDVKEKWELVRRRIRTRKDGAKVSALLGGYTVIEVDETGTLPIVVCQAHTDFHYKTLQNVDCHEVIKWALKVTLEIDCDIRLLPPNDNVEPERSKTMGFTSKGIRQLEEMKEHLIAADKCIDIDCTTQCFKHPIASEVDWMMWNMYLKIYVPGQYKTRMEIIEQLKMMICMALLDAVSLTAYHNVHDAYRQLDTQHAALRDIATGMQDLITALEQIKIYPMHRSNRAERRRAQFAKEKNELKRKGTLPHD